MSRNFYVKIYLLLIFLCHCSPTKIDTKSSSAKFGKSPILAVDNQSSSKISSMVNSKKCPTNEDGSLVVDQGDVSLDCIQVDIETSVGLQPSGVIENIDVPAIKIKKNPGFVKILRCAQSYEMKSLDGKLIEQLLDQKDSTDSLQWAWTQAINDSASCRIVSEHSLGLLQFDYSASSGTYYYAINPCVSLRDSEKCSYQIKKTEAFTYKSLLKEVLLDKTRELSQAQAQANANLERLNVLARLIELDLRACENIVAHNMQVLNFKKGLLQVGVLFGGILVGLSLPFIGGPMVGYMVGSMSVFMLAPYIEKHFTDWPASVEDVCSDPTAHDKTGIQAKLKEFDTLISQDVPNANTRIQKVLMEMSALEAKTITVDKAIESAKKQGFDPTDPEAFLNAQAGASSGLPALPPQ